MLASTFLLTAPLLLDLESPARAADPATNTAPARAAELRAVAAAAAKRARWDACIQTYAAALAVEDSPSTSGELGLCEERAGKFADAYRHLNRALDARPAGARGEPWSRYQAALARAMERVAILFLTVTPPEARVVLDGRPLSRADGRNIPLEPGKHTVAARLQGHEDAVESLTVSARDLPVVHLSLRPGSASEPPAPASASAPAASSPASSSASGEPRGASVAVAPPATGPQVATWRPDTAWYTPAWTVRGVLVPIAAVTLTTAVASTATWIGLEVDRASLTGTLPRDTATTACGPATTSRPAACAALAERYDQRNAALGVAIGATVTTGLLLGAARLAYSFEHAGTGAQVAPSVSASGGGVVLAGTW